MEFQVLGTLRVVEPTGFEVRLASASQRRLVSLLLQHPGHVVTVPHLVDQLELSAGALRTSVSRLRRVLGYDTLVTEAPGYTLCTDRIDAVRFDRLLSTARASGDPAEERRALEEALALWRGPAYEEFAEESWAVGEVSRLEGLRAEAVVRLSRLLVDACEWTAAIERLGALIVTHPYDDRPRALLMQALAGSGRRVEALRAFQDYRTLLLDEVGTEPAEATVELDRRIAQGGADAATSPPSAPRHDPPMPLGAFVGRQAERRVVAELIRTHRLVTLVGAGGCGKSRLAIEVAGDWAAANGAHVCWVDLASARGPADVAAALAGVADGAAPDRVLVVLDDAERVLEAVAAEVPARLDADPDLRVLVTSRELLGLNGEVVWRVPALSLPGPDEVVDVRDLDRFEAVQLLLDRGRLARPDLVVDDSTVPHLVTICRHLDGLPLGLELAAANLGSRPLDRLAAGIDDPLCLPSVGGQSAPSHHETLEASIAWSVDRLLDQERAVLGRLAVFHAGFDVEAALAVGSDAGDEGERLGPPPDADPSIDLTVAEVVTRLVDKNLVQLDTATNRYRMLGTVRRYCLGHEITGPDLERARARHAGYVARWCTDVGAGRHGIARGPIVDTMPDVVAAMAWARDQAPLAALQMCRGLANLRSTLGHPDDLVETWRWLQALDRDGPLAADWAGAAAALLASATGAGLDVAGWPEEVERRLAPDDRQARGWLVRGAAMVPAYRGDLAPIAAYATTIVTERYDVELSVYGGFAAYMLSLAGRLPEAEELVDALHLLARRHAVPFAVDTVGNGFAAAAVCRIQRGRLHDVADLVRGDARHPADPAFSITAAAALAQAAVLTGDPALLTVAEEWSHGATLPLLRFLDASVTFHRCLFDSAFEEGAHAAGRFWIDAAAVPVSRVNLRPMLNVALLETGRTAAAAAATEEAADLVAGMTDVPMLEAVVIQARAQVAWNTGRPEDAVAGAHALLDLATGHGFTLLVVDALELLALAEARRGADEVATWLLAATLAERERLGYRFVLHAPRAEREALAAAAASLSARPSIATAVATARLRHLAE